jgi:simple sugar transport system ATP-binding protein
MQGISKEFDGKWALPTSVYPLKRARFTPSSEKTARESPRLMKHPQRRAHANQGTITYDGTKVCFKNPQDASRLGIGIVLQHFMLIPMLKVWQNAILGIEPIRKNEKHR